MSANISETEKKLEKVAEAKSDIAAAISEQGGEVPELFAEYGNAIRSLPTNGVPVEIIEELRNGIAEERTERETADADLNERLSQEETSRLAAENDLKVNIIEEKTARETSYDLLSDRIADEISERGVEDGKLNYRIDTEIADRTQENTAINERIDQVEQTHADDKTELNTAIQGLQESKQDNLSFDGEYDKATNKVATVKTVTDKIAQVIANAPESYDTLAEIAAWIAEHPENVAELNRLINENKENITKNTEDIQKLDDEKFGKSGFSNFYGGEFAPLQSKASQNTTDIADVVAGNKQFDKVSVSGFDDNPTEYHSNYVFVNQRNRLFYPNKIGTLATLDDLQSKVDKTEFDKLKDGTDYVALATKAITDSQGSVIHETYETKAAATSKHTELSERLADLQIGRSSVYKAQSAIKDDYGNVIHEHYQTVDTANEQHDEIMGAMSMKASTKDFDALIQAIAETMPKVVRVF